MKEVKRRKTEQTIIMVDASSKASCSSMK